MNKNVIVEDFKKLSEGGIIERMFSSYDELLDVLSEMFSDEYEKESDAQDAFNNLDEELGGLLGKYCAVYTLGTKEWVIECSGDVSKEKIEEVIASWNDYYDDNLADINDLCDSITHRVMKDMSNCGCDVYNALSALCDDVFGDGHPFYVDLGDENPRISFLE